MKTWVLLLRGINVGGTGKLPMAGLRVLLGELGAENVATYIQSGNAVFTGDYDADKIARRIEDEVETHFGFRRDALVLPAGAMIAARDAFPFPEAVEAPKTGHVWFLTSTARPDLDAMTALATDNERFALGDGTFYLHAPDGIGRSKLAAKAEKLLGVPATARNLNTVNNLCDLAAAAGRSA